MNQKKMTRRHLDREKIGLLILTVFAVGLIPTSAGAQLSYDGYMFGDLYYIADHSNADIKGANGLMFRRIYNTLNFTLSDSISGRLRLEIANPGDFLTKEKMIPFVKDAYLQAKIGGQTLFAGISPTPTFNVLESIWGYRHLEKTPLDLYKFAPSREFGLALKGGKNVYYHVFLANGNGESSESNPGKKFMGALGFKPVEGLTLEVYADYEWDVKDGKTYNILQGMAGYQGSWGRAAVVYANRHYVSGDTKKDYGVFSGFAVIKASDKVEIIARYDKLLNEPVSGTVSYVPFSKNALANFIIAGISITVADNVWIIPNIKYAFYDEPDGGDTPGNDIYALVTFFWKWK
ncbi:MAG: hypothetical protein MUP98_19085 [Candidatus Aminicenantes bacterium]|nr:hypothetical protein [Candidatus Aminicenantes bacterium]